MSALSALADALARAFTVRDAAARELRFRERIPVIAGLALPVR